MRPLDTIASLGLEIEELDNIITVINSTRNGTTNQDFYKNGRFITTIGINGSSGYSSTSTSSMAFQLAIAETAKQRIKDIKQQIKGML